VPVDYDLNSKKGIVIIFKCQRCGAGTRNKANLEGEVPDDYDAILRLKHHLSWD
jgi:hypothetical protein